MNRTEFIATARSYLGTPFHHQGRLPNVGLDCAGVVVCALQANNYTVEDKRGYGRIPSQGIFSIAVESQCDLIAQEEVQVGDLMMFAFRDEPQHIAIVSGLNPTMLIHGYQTVNRVVENDLDATWVERLRGCYRLRGID
jgi:cell wall-associated NlpC family hydrolase